MEEENKEDQNVQTMSSYYDSGIEPEDESEVLDDPFNPEEISIDSKVVSMDNCLRRLMQGTIILNPDFQRKEVWTDEKKSQLIESLMLKIPLPMFYVSADEKNNYTVVDGLQRLSTIRRFILGESYLQALNPSDKSVPILTNREIENLRGKGFRLQKLEFWEAYNGKCFDELPINIQNNILDTEFRFTVINPGTPEEVRRNIFKRINTGGLPLSGQEIRNALYIGKSTLLLNDLAESKEFKNATFGSIRSLRMEDRELVLRFLSFLIRDYTTYRKTVNADTLMSDTMIIINSMPNFNSKEFKKLSEREKLDFSDISIHNLKPLEEYFKIAMTRSLMLFGKHTFRKSYGDKSRSPINKALFETWGVLLSKVSEVKFQNILANRDAFLLDYANIIDSYDFQIATSRDSMKHASVKFRFETLKQLIDNHATDN